MLMYSSLTTSSLIFVGKSVGVIFCHFSKLRHLVFAHQIMSKKVEVTQIFFNKTFLFLIESLDLYCKTSFISLKYLIS
jgi:hypothetical protein